jgi:hypothetical protein
MTVEFVAYGLLCQELFNNLLQQVNDLYNLSNQRLIIKLYHGWCSELYKKKIFRSRPCCLWHTLAWKILLGNHLMFCKDAAALSASANGILKYIPIIQLSVRHEIFH